MSEMFIQALRNLKTKYHIYYIVKKRTVTMADIEETLVSVDKRYIYISKFRQYLTVFHMFTVGDEANINSIVHFVPYTFQYLTDDTSDEMSDPLSLTW